MTVKSGGYQTGLSYSRYRQFGHNPLSAIFMTLDIKILYAELILLGLMAGWLIGSML